jgi:serine acetyltransferase
MARSGRHPIIVGISTGHGAAGTISRFGHQRHLTARAVLEGWQGLSVDGCLRNGSRTTVKGTFSIFSNFHLGVGSHAELTLGSGFINAGSLIVCNHKVTIGENCMIADQVIIRDDDGHEVSPPP